MEAFAVAIQSVINDSGFLAFSAGNAIMILVGLLLLYLAFAREFEPLLLGPIAFGCVLANIPRNGFEEGVMALISAGISQEIFPPLIFLGVGAMTDFGPLIANPKTLLLGAAAQIGVFRCIRWCNDAWLYCSRSGCYRYYRWCRWSYIYLFSY